MQVIRLFTELHKHQPDRDILLKLYSMHKAEVGPLLTMAQVSKCTLHTAPSPTPIEIEISTKEVHPTSLSKQLAQYSQWMQSLHSRPYQSFHKLREALKTHPVDSHALTLAIQNADNDPDSYNKAVQFNQSIERDLPQLISGLEKVWEVWILHLETIQFKRGKAQSHQKYLETATQALQQANSILRTFRTKRSQKSVLQLIDKLSATEALVDVVIRHKTNATKDEKHRAAIRLEDSLKKVSSEVRHRLLSLNSYSRTISRAGSASPCRVKTLDRSCSPNLRKRLPASSDNTKLFPLSNLPKKITIALGIRQKEYNFRDVSSVIKYYKLDYFISRPQDRQFIYSQVATKHPLCILTALRLLVFPLGSKELRLILRLRDVLRNRKKALSSIKAIHSRHHLSRLISLLTILFHN